MNISKALTNYAELDVTQILDKTNHYAKNHINDQEREKYQQACNIIAAELEKNPETAKEKFQEKFRSGLQQDIEDYERGKKFTSDENNIVDTMKLGKALRIFDKSMQQND